MGNQTINDLMAARKQISERKSELERLRSSSLQVVNREINGEKTETKPVYDAKKLDKKITTIQNWLYKIDAEIHRLNSVTQSNINVPVEELLEVVE